jgi:putative ABC transport system substrate-binding protein
MEALKQIAPGLKTVTTIFNPQTAPYHSLYLRAIETAAASLVVEPMMAEVRDDADIERAISALASKPNSGLIVMPDTFNFIHRQTIIALVGRYRLPAIYYFPLFARDGGLISYGPDEIDMFRRAAGYVDRIFKGDKASDLPVQQPTNYRVVINLKTAKTLGIEIPASLLARADEVIE